MLLDGLVQSATIKVGGAEISQELYARLSEVRVETGFGAAGWFELRFVSEDPLDSKFAIGKEVSIGFDDARGNNVDVFSGTVDSLAVDHARSRRQLIVSGYDARRKLGSAPKVKAYAKQSYSSILQAIARDCGLQTDFDIPSGPKFEHVMQTSSNTHFVAEICRRLGLEWHVEETKLVVRKPTAGPSVALEFGKDLEAFSARFTTAEHPGPVQVNGWDSAKKEAITATERKVQSSPLGSVAVERTGRPKSDAKRSAVSWSRPIVSQADGEHLATGFARRMVSGDLVGRGETSGNPSIVPGVMVDITGIDENWNGTYFVTTAEHVFRGTDRYVTRFTVGGYESTSVVDLMGTSSRQGGVGFGSGVTIGIVTNNRNTESADQALVKVKFPYLANDVESAWARVATIGAGGTRGIMFMPEVNDEVLVAFEHGDVNRPYVIGSVWNGKDAPPLDRTGKDDDLDKRQIVSRLGHKLTFHDGSSDEKKLVSIELADKKTKVHVGHDKVEIIANDGKPIEVKNDKAKVVFTGGGDLQLEAENITIKAKQKLKLDANEIETSSQANTKITANAKLDVKSAAPATVESSAILTLKGTMVKVN